MRAILIALIMSVLAIEVIADGPREAVPRHTRVALFKNGLAMVETRVDLGELSGEGEYRLSPLPPARLGSLWIGWPEGLAVEDIHSARVRGEERKPATDIAGLLRGSVGRPIGVWVEGAWVEGELLPLAEAEEPPVIDGQEAWRSSLPYPPGAGPALVMLKQGEQVVALPLGSITRVRVAQPVEGDVPTPTWEEALLFRAEATGEGPREVTLRYLVQGLAWSPSYVVELTGEDTARMSAKAVIVNDFADLEGVDVELVAGFPHVPLAATEEATTLMPLQAWLQQLRSAGGAQDNFMSNTAGAYLLRQRAEYAVVEPSVAAMPIAPIGGEASEDLFFFQMNGVSVGKGERLYRPLFAADVPVEHVFTWEIPDYVDEQRGYRDEPAAAEQPVWHALRLTNTTGQPWTTAAGMTMKGGRVLGQDTLHYTPPGAETDLRITQAVSVKAEQTEREVERERNAEQFYGSRYDKVTVEGELVLTNYREEPVTVQVTKMLTGEVETADGEPEVVKLARGLRKVNPTSKLAWEVDVEPGAGGVARVAYRYTVFVRN